MTPRIVTVTLLHTPRRPWSVARRHQPWRWVAKAANGRTLATSGERYSNKADAIDAIYLLFSAAEVVFDGGEGTYRLRSAL